jgi:hypothetical protein
MLLRCHTKYFQEAPEIKNRRFFSVTRLYFGLKKPCLLPLNPGCLYSRIVNHLDRYIKTCRGYSGEEVEDEAA